MRTPATSLWSALEAGGQRPATEDEYEHGYQRSVVRNLERYVAFDVRDEVYALEIRSIIEITKLFTITPVPRSADFVLGIGNVRGMVLPVIDLSVRLGLGPCKRERSARMLIVRLEDEPYGLLVERVLEVHELSVAGLEQAPQGIGSTRAECINALGRYGSKIMIILDLTTLLTQRDFISPSYASGRPGDRHLP
ncbi:MAG: chemotaxis protein CheW [Nannocystaceae bacterium]